MKQIAQVAAVVAAFGGITPQVAAQEWVFGVGYASFSADDGQDGVGIGVNYFFEPFHQADRFSLGWGVGLGVDQYGDAHLGGGLVGTYDFSPKWFVQASVMPGLYYDGEEANDLGSAFEILSTAAVGYRLENGSAVSLAVSHASNASTADRNPGVNAVSIQWHWAH